MTGRERRLLRMLCMTASGGGGGGDKPWEEMTWDDVIAATKNGKYKNFEIGAMKELDLGSEGIVHMQIVGIDADELADGSGKAPLTFISKELLNTSHRMNPRNNNNQEGTGTIGGWGMSEMRTFLKTTIKPLIPSSVRDAIKPVTKYNVIYNTSAAKTTDVTTDDVWIPSSKEIFDDESTIISGPAYTDLFNTDEDRKKHKINSSDNTYWWLRSAGSRLNFKIVTPSGTGGTGPANNESNAITLGFCL